MTTRRPPTFLDLLRSAQGAYPPPDPFDGGSWDCVDGFSPPIVGISDEDAGDIHDAMIIKAALALIPYVIDRSRYPIKWREKIRARVRALLRSDAFDLTRVLASTRAGGGLFGPTSAELVDAVIMQVALLVMKHCLPLASYPAPVMADIVSRIDRMVDVEDQREA